MAVIVLGCGRSGTNMLLALVRGSSRLKATARIEDKRFAAAGRRFPSDYLSKCDTTYCSAVRLQATLRRNPGLKVLWAIRNPKDICLSKMRRGQPGRKGGDRKKEPSLDSTPEGCVSSIKKMFELYKVVHAELTDRVLVVKMEDIICNPKKEAKRICHFLGIRFESAMLSFPVRMRNKQKVERYGGKLCKSQIDLWKRVPEIYNGFFKKFPVNTEQVFAKVEHVTSYFGYE